MGGKTKALAHQHTHDPERPWLSEKQILSTYLFYKNNNNNSSIAIGTEWSSLQYSYSYCTEGIHLYTSPPTTHTHAHTYTHIHVHILYTYMHTHARINSHVNVCIVYTYIHAYTYVHIRTHLCVHVSIVFHEAFHHLQEPPLARHVQGGRICPAPLALWGGPRGTVHVSPRADEERGGRRVVQQDGSVEKGEGGPVRGHVPGIGITPVDYLVFKKIIQQTNKQTNKQTNTRL